MIDRKVRSERFRWGISILDAYLYYNEKENFHDINIVSETFFSDLLKGNRRILVFLNVS